MSAEEHTTPDEPEATVPRRFDVNNPAKFYGILLYLTLASVGWFIGRMETLEWIAATGPVIGYMVGNGVNASKNQPTEPIFKHRPEE